MTFRATFVRGLTAGLMAAALSVPLAKTASAADDLISFLWGGGSDWGGGRQSVSFSPQYKHGRLSLASATAVFIW